MGVILFIAFCVVSVLFITKAVTVAIKDLKQVNVVEAQVVEVETKVEAQPTGVEAQLKPTLDVAVGEFTRRAVPPEVVTFDLFTTSSDGLFAVPVIKTPQGVGPYLGEGQPLVNTYPHGDQWINATWKHVKIVDGYGKPVSGMPGIYRTVEGVQKYQTHIWALVPAKNQKG